MSLAGRVAQGRKKEETKKKDRILKTPAKPGATLDVKPKTTKSAVKQPAVEGQKSYGVIPPKNKPSKFSALDAHESDGKPVEIRLWNPTTRRDPDPNKVETQHLEIDLYAKKIEQQSQKPGRIAHVASGNNAPPIPLEEYGEWTDDMATSACLPGDVYDGFYRTGGILKSIEEAKELQEKYRDIDRQTRVRDESELEELYKQFIIPKGGTVELPEWDPRTFPADGTMVLFGRRRSGKSWLIRWILNMYKHTYRQVVVLTNTKQNLFWAHHIPFRFIHEYSQFVIQKILVHQRSVMAWNALHADEPEMLINPYMAVILDDVVAHDLQHDEMLKALFYEGRHSNIAIFITTQHPKALPPGVRSNADVAVIFPQISEGDTDAIRFQYCSFFENKHDFVLFLNENTKDHGCVIIFMGDPQALPVQRLYHYTADDPGPFLTCAAEYWDGSNEYYKKYLEAQAAFLAVRPDESSSASNTADRIPGSQLLNNDDETDDLIRAATF